MTTKLATKAALQQRSVSVKDHTFNAVGNGSTDDRSAFNDANAVTAPKVVPSGTYKISSVLTLSGEWRFLDGAVLKPDNGIVITVDSTARIYSPRGAWLDTTAGGSLSAANGSYAAVVEPGEHVTGLDRPNIKQGFAGNRITTGGSANTISGGGGLNTENIIGTVTTPTAGQINVATIAGGYDHKNDMLAGTISGGGHNELHGDIAGSHGVIGGGSLNIISRGDYSTIGGGTSNRIHEFRLDGTTSVTGDQCVIGGGSANHVYGASSTVSGGDNNAADGTDATVAGGARNKALGNFSTVSGGADNEARLGTSGAGQKNTISGGRTIVIDSSTSPVGNTVGGGENHAVYGSYNTVAGGLNNDIGISGTEPIEATISGGLDNTITGAAKVGGVVGGGRSNAVSNSYGTIAGGRDGVVDGVSGTVGGGNACKARGDYSTVSGGTGNEARAGTSAGGTKNTISGGSANIIDSSTSPANCTISGGENHNVFGTGNTVGGGLNNDIGVSGTEPLYATIAGGLDNAITGSAQTGGSILGGRSNATSAPYASVLGGRENSSTGDHCSAVGYQAKSTVFGGLAIAGGQIAAKGDAQGTLLGLKIQTTDATATLMTNSVAQTTQIMPNDTTWGFVALITARRTDADNESAFFKLEGCIDRNTNAASTALVGAVTKTVIARDTAAWDVAALAGTASGGLQIQVTGEAAKTINWSCLITPLGQVTG